MILSYASNLARYTSAPPTMEPLLPESMFNGPINPPFPTVEMMRRGKMNFEPPLGTLGETREVGRRKFGRSTDSYNSTKLLVFTGSPGLSPSLAQSHLDASQPSLAHGGPTQYSTYAAAQQQASSSANLDNLFDLDLNPDF